MRNEGGGRIVEATALPAVDDAIVQISVRQSPPPAVRLRRLAGARATAGSAGADRPA